MADGAVIVGSDDTLLYGLDASGRSLWTQRTLGPINASPAVGLLGEIAIAAQDGAVYYLA
jgi:outer membrane protein assembly factor BamB